MGGFIDLLHITDVKTHCEIQGKYWP